jgi:hypothetical protein
MLISIDLPSITNYIEKLVNICNIEFISDSNTVIMFEVM